MLRHARGVSLIELVVGLCITAILFAISVSGFRDQESGLRRKQFKMACS